MPYFNLVTNVPRKDIPENFMAELASLLADSVGKPLTAVSVRILPDQMMYYRGDDSPFGEATLRSIGGLGEEENIKHSKVICDKMAELGITSGRVRIFFHDIPSHTVGVDGTTCQEIYKR